MLNNVRHRFERRWFGILSRIELRLGIPISKLRVFFIYSIFATAGFFFLFYLLLGFLLWLKDCIITKRPNVFDL